MSDAIATEAREIVRRAAGRASGLTVKAQIRQAARNLGFPAENWRVREAWYGRAGNWSAQAAATCRTGSSRGASGRPPELPPIKPRARRATSPIWRTCVSPSVPNSKSSNGGSPPAARPFAWRTRTRIAAGLLWIGKRFRFAAEWVAPWIKEDAP